MDVAQLVLQGGTVAALMVAMMWISSLREQVKGLQERLDRLQARQDELLKHALQKTDLRDE